MSVRDPPDRANAVSYTHLEIAEYFGRISGYAVEETPYNSGFAGYKDWFIQYYDRPGYTIEAVSYTHLDVYKRQLF